MVQEDPGEIQEERKASRMKPAIVVTGCGRSGTLYMSKYFNAMGLGVQHEQHGVDGISSWYVGSPDRANITKNYYSSKMRGIKVIHLVREPMAVMSSMRRCEALRNRAGLDIFRRMYPNLVDMRQPDFLATWWVEWNKNVRRVWDVDYTLRVENAPRPSIIKEICSLAEVPFTMDIVKGIQSIPTNTHHIEEKYREELMSTSPQVLEDLTWIDLSLRQADQVAELACLFGYGYRTLSDETGLRRCAFS